MSMIRPKGLQKGDLVAVAAPAGAFDRKEFEAGVKGLKDLGFEVTFRDDIFSEHLYMAGTDERRADEINGFFADPNIRAIFFARGGYGTQRILPLLDLEIIKNNPKVVLGYSDITALHSFLMHHEIGGSFYGPTVTKHFKQAPKETLSILYNSITSTKPLGNIEIAGANVLKGGQAEGKLIGGCLSLISSSIGTPYDLNTDDSILFLEDVGEPVYKYDRMLTHLKAAGKLRGVRGIIFGSFAEEDKKLEEKMIADVLGDFPGPIINRFPAGHFDLKKLFVTIPLGVKASLTTEPIKLKILEPALI